MKKIFLLQTVVSILCASSTLMAAPAVLSDVANWARGLPEAGVTICTDTPEHEIKNCQDKLKNLAATLEKNGFTVMFIEKCSTAHLSACDKGQGPGQGLLGSVQFIM